MRGTLVDFLIARLFWFRPKSPVIRTGALSPISSISSSASEASRLGISIGLQLPSVSHVLHRSHENEVASDLESRCESRYRQK